MSIDNHIWQLAEAYVTKQLPATELEVLRVRLQSDSLFAADFNECADLLRSLEANKGRQQVRSMLREVHQQQEQPIEKSQRSIPLRTHYLRTGAIAAGIALLTSATTYWAFNHTDKKATSQYSVLRHELENIRKSQNQLIENINQKNATPPSPVRYTGTGFAITNNGYLVTNYHVTDGADSIYIQTHKGEYYKVHLVAFEPKNDIAILKVDDNDFRFGKSEVPYTFAPSKAGLGARVFTLGYPDDAIVYNEGYISSKNGFENDSMQYRLELPADPGQSGAPVLDANGNVIAIVTARGNESEGNTYAVSTKALLQFIHESLPKQPNLHLPKNNRLTSLNREEQIARLSAYTCSIKVYKK